MAEQLKLFPAPSSLSLTGGYNSGCQGEFDTELPVSWDDSLKPQAYSLRIGSRSLEIRASTAQGAFYAGQTFRQIRACYPREIPCMIIEDEPDFPARGLMLDVSRCKVPTMETLFDLVEWMGSVKLNQLQLYIEHTFAFPGHRIVWEDASPFTTEEINALDQFCHERFIELVPNLNSFGHMERWLRHDRYRHLAECPSGFTHPVSKKNLSFGSTLTPSPASLDFLESLYDAYLPSFTSRIFNIGGDEPWELGKGRSREDVENRGKGEVYIDFLRSIYEKVKKRGYVMQCWADIILEHHEILPRVPQDIIPVIWGYTADFDFATATRLVSSHCRRFYVAPGNNTWGSFTGRLPEALGNMRNAARAGLQSRAEGYLMTSWGDEGNHQPWITLYPALLQGACSAWGMENNQEVDLESGLAQSLLSSREQARVLLAMGAMDRLLPVPNRENPSWRSPAHLYLFLDTDSLKRTLKERGAKPTTRQLKAYLDRARELRAQISGMEDSLPVREMRMGLEMAELGARRVLRLLHGRKDKMWNADLDRLRGEFEQVWLERARPGGLSESLSYFDPLEA